jgi:DNA helicase-2/ATP-dependent DNA helicase PcrA
VTGPETILEGLNEAQREAATAVRGPVAILAGAGTGKTTTITRRIAYQAATGTYRPEQILAVTFTEKAARELKERLAKLGVRGVEAKTFHAAALSHLRRWWPRHSGFDMPDILGSKAPIISSLAAGLPPPHKFLPRGELAGEIEWAKNRGIDPDRYLAAIEQGEHEPPIPADLMLELWRGYERRKERTRSIDFEDMLGMAVRLFTEDQTAAAEMRERIGAITVDEYQDVNPLQGSLLEAWLGGRDEVCVVGDDYQTIYSFTGASPEHLLGFPKRYPAARIVRLEENYRSSPQVLTMANTLARKLGGFEKRLRAVRGAGPEPITRALQDQASEEAFVVEEIQRLRQAGTPLEEMAILYRINARSEPWEEALAAASVPYQVRDGAFLRRPGPRSVLAGLRKATSPDGVAAAVETVTAGLGYDPDRAADDAQEITRQADLGRLRALAKEYETNAGDFASIDGFVAELQERFSTEHEGRGVNLLTYHRSKGLEFDVVFLPRLLDRELPFRSGRSVSDPAEERRLLYVGITRAREYLAITWPKDARNGPSPYLRELGLASQQGGSAGTKGSRRGTGGSGGNATRTSPTSKAPVNVNAEAGDLYGQLKAWRRTRAKQDGVPAYVVFHDTTLAAIAQRRPSTSAGLAAIPGVGPAKLERYADEVLTLVQAGSSKA